MRLQTPALLHENTGRMIDHDFRYGRICQQGFKRPQSYGFRTDGDLQLDVSIRGDGALLLDQPAHAFKGLGIQLLVAEAGQIPTFEIQSRQ